MQLSVTRQNIENYRKTLLESAKKTQVAVENLTKIEDSMEFMLQLKFNPIGCDPLDTSRQLNIIEQLNQSFTYLASFDGAKYIFENHPEIENLTLNLGTSSGSDIESKEGDGIAAEVFATVTPKNNQKLAKDIQKVLTTNAQHRYVFFMSPKFKAGPYPSQSKIDGVIVRSLDYYL